MPLPSFPICSFLRNRFSHWVLSTVMEKMICLPPSTISHPLCESHNSKGWRQEGALCSLSPEKSLGVPVNSINEVAQLTKVTLPQRCRQPLSYGWRSPWSAAPSVQALALWNETWQCVRGCAASVGEDPLSLHANDEVGRDFNFLQPLFLKI